MTKRPNSRLHAPETTTEVASGTGETHEDAYSDSGTSPPRRDEYSTPLSAKREQALERSGRLASAAKLAHPALNRTRLSEIAETKTPGNDAGQMHEGDAFCDGGSSPPDAADSCAPSSAERDGSVEPTGDHADAAPAVKLATSYPSVHLPDLDEADIAVGFVEGQRHLPILLKGMELLVAMANGQEARTILGRSVRCMNLEYRTLSDLRTHFPDASVTKKERKRARRLLTGRATPADRRAIKTRALTPPSDRLTGSAAQEFRKEMMAAGRIEDHLVAHRGIPITVRLVTWGGDPETTDFADVVTTMGLYEDGEGDCFIAFGGYCPELGTNAIHTIVHESNRSGSPTLHWTKEEQRAAMEHALAQVNQQRAMFNTYGQLPN